MFKLPSQQLKVALTSLAAPRLAGNPATVVICILPLALVLGGLKLGCSGRSTAATEWLIGGSFVVFQNGYVNVVNGLS